MAAGRRRGHRMGSTRSTQVEIELACLERNYHRLRGTHRRRRLMTVVKADAYGHGMVPVARFLAEQGQRLFAVAVLEEALTLRRAGIQGRILVLGPPEPRELEAYAAQRIELTVPSLVHLRWVVQHPAAAGLELHLKCDTGMGRIGLQPAATDALLKILDDAPHLRVRGRSSHFAEAERLDSPYCDAQLAAFEEWRRLLPARGRNEAVELHLSNSAGLLRDARYHFDYARVGFALWSPLVFVPQASQPPLNGELEAVMTLKSRISLVKRMQAGTTVGYSRTYRCGEDEVIATLPIGYGDGYFRALGNRGQVSLRGLRYPIVGNVSMDQIRVSLGHDEAEVGDEVLLLGGGRGGIPAAEVGSWAGTIDYEVFAHLNGRIPRIYLYDGKPVAGLPSG